MSTVRTRLRIMSWKQLGRTTDDKALTSRPRTVCWSLLGFIRRTKSLMSLAGQHQSIFKLLGNGGNFESFHPAGVACCTDSGEIWRGRPLLRASYHPPSVQG